MDFKTEIKSMIVKQFSVDLEDVVDDAHLQDDLGADSLALLNLATAVGKRYGIEIIYDDMADLNNVAELIQLVESKISAA